MLENNKAAITLALEILRTTLVEAQVSIGVDKDKGELLFFDTSTYLREKRFDGINVKIESLVK